MPPSRGHLAIFEDTVGCHISGVLLSSGRQRTSILPNILQCIGLLPMTSNYSAQNVSTTEVKKQALRCISINKFFAL